MGYTLSGNRAKARSDEPFRMSRGNSFFIQYLTAEVWASGPKNPRPKCFQKTPQTRRSKPLWSLVGGGPVKRLWSFVGGYPISLPPSQPNPLCTERRCGNTPNLGRGSWSSVGRLRDLQSLGCSAFMGWFTNQIWWRGKHMRMPRTSSPRYAPTLLRQA